MDDVHGAEEIRLAPHHLLAPKLEVKAVAQGEGGVELPQFSGVVIVQHQVVLGAGAKSRQTRRERTHRHASRSAQQEVHGVRAECRCVGKTLGIDQRTRRQAQQRSDNRITTGTERDQCRLQLAGVLQASLVAGTCLAGNTTNAGDLEGPEVECRLQLAAVTPHRQLALAILLATGQGQAEWIRESFRLELVTVLQVHRQVLANVAGVREIHRLCQTRRQNGRSQQSRHTGRQCRTNPIHTLLLHIG